MKNIPDEIKEAIRRLSRVEGIPVSARILREEENEGMPCVDSKSNHDLRIT